MLSKNCVTFNSYKDFQSYIINLDREYLRYLQTKARLMELGFTKLSRWEATDYKKEDVNTEIKRMGVEHLERFCNDAEIACALSHIKVMAHFLSSKEEYCLVFEDDIIAHPNFKNLSSFEDIKYGEFDVLMLGGIFVDYVKDGIRYLSLAETLDLQNKQTHVDNVKFWQTHAYIASREFAYKLISRYREWTNTEEYKHPQLDRYISEAPWFRTKLISDQTSEEIGKYRMSSGYSDKICGILFQDNNNVSTIQTY